MLVIGSGGRGKLCCVLNHQQVCGCLCQRVVGAGLCCGTHLSSALLPARTCLEELFRHVAGLHMHACADEGVLRTEHSLCWKLKQSPQCGPLFCLPGNAGIASVAECVHGIGVADVPKVRRTLRVFNASEHCVSSKPAGMEISVPLFSGARNLNHNNQRHSVEDLILCLI